MMHAGGTFEEVLERGKGAHRAGRVAEAEGWYRAALASRPGDVEGLFHVGIVLVALKRAGEGVAFLKEAAEKMPGAAHVWHALGVALVQAGDAEAGEAAVRRAIALNGGQANYHYDLGVALAAQKKWEEAVGAYERSLALMPGNGVVYSNIGTARAQQGRQEEAVAAYKRALEIQPDFPPFLVNLANTYEAMSRFDDAVDVTQRLMAVAPDFPDARYTLSIGLRDSGQVEAALEVIEGIKGENVEEYALRQRLPLLHYHPKQSAEAILESHRKWGEKVPQLATKPGAFANVRDAGKRLKIGYVSPDLRAHVVGRNVMPLFRHHDHERFEIFAYPLNTTPDVVTEIIRSHCDHWRPMTNVKYVDVAAMVRADGIDVLVDLALHTKGNGLPLFAMKPAPVQMTFAGYPGTTGLPTMDYRITDGFLDPVGEAEHYVEKSLRITSFWCYEGLKSDVPVNELPALRGEDGEGFTFGSMNAALKLNEGMMRLWARAMREVAGSRIVILFPAGKSRERVAGVFEREGIAPGRVVFLDRASPKEYLAKFHEIDLCLDTLPYNGHTTSLDALWMGVPTLTLVGKTVVGRAGLSQLSNVGLTEFVTWAEEEFVGRAGEIARDLEGLARVRRELRRRMEGSVLLDGGRFAREIEGCYREGWRAWCAE